MNENNTMKEIAEQLLNADKILIFPHVSMDGDAFGSSASLCRALRMLGKSAFVLIEEEIPKYLAFLDDGYCSSNQNVIPDPNICVCVDCADIERFILRKEKFLQGKITMCIDHHKTSGGFADYNYIDENAAATAEIIYKLLLEMNVVIDKKIGEAIYAAIVSDTGNFQYSNTLAETHLITVELFKAGIDNNYVNRMLYQNVRIEKLRIAGRIFQTLKIIGGGQAIIGYVTQEMLSEANALMEDTEGLSETFRDITNIEVGIFAKETKQFETKFSMRSKTWVDVTTIAEKYKGGGHSRAAGCTIKAPIREAIKLIEADLEEYFREQSDRK